MSQEILALVIFLILSVGAWWVFFIEQQAYWLDLTRQRLFKIRNDLFDAAAGGKIAFDDPAYVMTRNTLNGMITFTHEVNLLQVAAIYASHKYILKGRRSTDYGKRFLAAIKGLSKENRRLIMGSMEKAHLTILRHLMSTSILLWPVLKPASIIFAILHKTDDAKKVVLKGKKSKESWQVLDAEALHIGESNAHGDYLQAA